MALRTQINTILVLYSVLVCTVNNPWRLSYLIFTMEPFVLHHLAPDHLQRVSGRNADVCFVVKPCDMKGAEDEIWQRGGSLFPPSSFCSVDIGSASEGENDSPGQMPCLGRAAFEFRGDKVAVRHMTWDKKIFYPLIKSVSKLVDISYITRKYGLHCFLPVITNPRLHQIRF